MDKSKFDLILYIFVFIIYTQYLVDFTFFGSTKIMSMKFILVTKANL